MRLLHQISRTQRQLNASSTPAEACSSAELRVVMHQLQFRSAQFLDQHFWIKAHRMTQVEGFNKVDSSLTAFNLGNV